MIIDGQEYVVKIGSKTYHCAVDISLGYIGGKWKSVVLFYLIEGTKRYSELRRLMPDITEKMLAKQLRELCADDLVNRHDHRVIPPKVEYSLTEEGRSLIPLLEAMSTWGKLKSDREGGKFMVIRDLQTARRQKS